MNFILKLLLILLTTNTLIASTNLQFNENKYSDKQIKKRIQSFESMIKSAKNEKLIKKLKIVNNYFNKISYSSDIKNWKKNDYWATPLEFLSSGAGDCEDYAISKYFTLRKLGISKNKLSLTYAKLTKTNQAHIVLSYYHKPNSIPIILDNVNKKLQLSINRKDLTQMRNIEDQVILSKFKLQKL